VFNNLWSGYFERDCFAHNDIKGGRNDIFFVTLTLSEVKGKGLKRIATPSARNDNRKGRNDTTSLSLRGTPPPSLRGTKCRSNPKLKPKLKAVNSEQYQKSNIKSQNDKLKCKNLPHFDL